MYELGIVDYFFGMLKKIDCKCLLRFYNECYIKCFFKFFNLFMCI